jgi:hypothetical protein
VFQHRAAVSVGEELGHLGKDHLWLAKKTGVDPGWLLYKMRGPAPADLGEILERGLMLGVRVLLGNETVRLLRGCRRVGAISPLSNPILNERTFSRATARHAGEPGWAALSQGSQQRPPMSDGPVSPWRPAAVGRR